MLPFAIFIRRRYASGFTVSGLMRRIYGRPAQWLYTLTLGGLAMLSVSVNLLAGGTVLSMLTGLPMAVTAGGMLLLVLAYTYSYGVKASIVTDVVQVLLIILVLLVLVPGTFALTGWDVLAEGIKGINQVTGFVSSSGLQVALTFGIISAIGLAAGPVGDQAFWQRAFAMRDGEVVKAFGGGAAVFTLVPLLMTFLGFAAAGSGFTPTNPGYVNLELVQQLFPGWVAIPFMLLLVSALFSTVNSHLLAQASLVSDYTGSIRAQRATMLLLAGGALIVALVPGNSVTSMFLIYSTLRSSTFLITLTTLSGCRWNSRGVAWGIGLGLAIGMPLTIYGNVIVGAWQYRLVAITVTTLLPLVVAMAATAFRRPVGEAEPAYLSAAQLVSEG
jgi:Na+/proline symporter